MTGVHALIAVKDLGRAKSRLAPDLDPDARERLVLAMLADTVAAARAVAAIDSITVVTPDATVVAAARELGAEVYADPVDGAGLNAALTAATDRLRAERGPVEVVVLQADLPALRPAELSAALAAAPPGRRSVIVDHLDTGTSALLLRDPALPLAPMFGTDSANRHVRGGGTPLEGDWPGLRLDVDTADDLRSAARLGVGPATREFLDDVGWADRVSARDDVEDDARVSNSEIIDSATGLTAPPAATPDLLPTPDLLEDRYLNRELSWLDFNSRVLALAEDPSLALLERAKFLAIFASNLDEFYMVRVAGLKRRDETGLSVRSADGLSPREQLELIAKRTQELADRHARVFLDSVLPALEAEGIAVDRWADLNSDEQQRLSTYFQDQVFPVLTPLAVDPAHPFPFVSGLSLNLAVTVKDSETGGEHFARVKVPDNVDRFLRVRRGDGPAAVAAFVPMEELIAAHLDLLFPGMEIVEHHAFRITRNADFEVEEDRDEDLLQALERELARRRFGSPVRLEVADDMTEHMLELLLRELDVDPADVIQVPGLLDLSCLMQVYGVDRPQLKDRPFVPATHPAFGEGETPKSVFATLRERDVLVHHPYDSFSTSVQRFIEQAAADPQVLAIKQTLYRTSGDSPIVNALIDAAEAGKQVVALVEIKARFDEQANIKWARQLEQAGVHVVYGLVGLKTHCKTALVVRREGSTIRRYCHIGTGNYNPKTARLYEDVGIFSAAPEIGADLTDLFNSLTGYSRKAKYRNLLVAPYGVRSGIIDRIDQEIEIHRSGGSAGIRLKANAIVDEQVIDALYRASLAGVGVQIVVRGICALKPGVPGLSENIEVRSILGRFLEHSRILHFVGSNEYWIGSADMMHRNLDRRVEVMAQVTDSRLAEQLGANFDSALDPRTRCWVLQPDGSWTGSPASGEQVVDYQEQLMRQRRTSTP